MEIMVYKDAENLHMIEVEAKKVFDFGGFSFFVHSLTPGEFSIVEGSSGVKVTMVAKTKKEAISSAKSMLETYKDELAQRIRIMLLAKEQIKLYGFISRT